MSDMKDAQGAVRREHDAASEEWHAWHGVTDALLAVGAVTQADLEASILKNETPGQRAMQAIRAWGKALVNLTEAQRRMP